MTTRASGYREGEPSECSPEQFRAWVADHQARGITRVELAACLDVSIKRIDNWRQGNGKVPRWVVRKLRAEGVPIKCVNPGCTKFSQHGRRCWGCARYYTAHGVERPAAHCGRTMTRCTTERCANPVCTMPRDRRRRTARCNACENYRKRHGHERPALLALAQPRHCSVSGCTRPHEGRGLCRDHYMQAWRAVRAGRAAWVSERSAPLCALVACWSPVQARQLCATHYVALWRAERRAQLTAAS